MGTPASIKFEGREFLQIYSHYDGYPEGVALKLYETFKSFDFDPAYLHTLGNAPLINRFIANNPDSLGLESGRSKCGAEWFYLINEQGGTIEYGQMDNGRRLMNLYQFINQNVARWFYLQKSYMEKHGGQPDKETLELLRNFSPAIQITEKYTSPLYLTADKSPLVCTALLEEANKWELDRPNNPNIKRNLERVKVLNNWAESANNSDEMKRIQAVGEWMEERAEGGK